MTNFNDITAIGGHSDKQQSFESRFKEAMEGGVTEVTECIASVCWVVAHPVLACFCSDARVPSDGQRVVA